MEFNYTASIQWLGRFGYNQMHLSNGALVIQKKFPDLIRYLKDYSYCSLQICRHEASSFCKQLKTQLHFQYT